MDGPPETFGSPYRLLSAAVVPRPIAWVSSRGPRGENLAPFSFFNVVAIDPPIVMVAPVGVGEDRKDTPENVLATEAFAVNVVTGDLVEAMNETAATLAPGESEFERAGVTAVEATAVDAPRVAEAHVSFECTLSESMELGGSTLLFGEVVHAHVDDDLLVDGKLDVTKLDAVGRLAGGYYASTRDRYHLERPP
ncbi:flavin reductase family protein [Salinigranum marinum]|uniref:flavin reductase family protein n=1 Tax=Salinigranum marinum TaxID=1515595 RepID=UPI00298A0350|nr:flavin reductase family protein [Salinigranum marinum]